MFPERIRRYLMTTMKVAPSVVSVLTAAEADFRPGPDRFTIRA